MATELKSFEFCGMLIRTIVLDTDGWFLAQDVAEYLEYNQTSDMTKRLDSDEKRNYPISDKSGNYTNQTLISEYGVYEAILGSKKKEAKKFKRWLKREVLPELRRTGSYNAPVDILPTVVHPTYGYPLVAPPEDLTLRGERNTYARTLMTLGFRAPTYIQELTDLVNQVFTGDRARHLRFRYGITNRHHRTRKELDANLRRAMGVVERTVCARFQQMLSHELNFENMLRVAEDIAFTVFQMYLERDVDLIENIPRRRLDEEHNARLFSIVR